MPGIKPGSSRRYSQCSGLLTISLPSLFVGYLLLLLLFCFLCGRYLLTEWKVVPESTCFSLTKLAECNLRTWAILKPETCGEVFQSDWLLGRGEWRSGWRGVTDATVLSLADFGTASWPSGWSFSSKTIVLLPWWPWLSLVCEAWSPQRPVLQLLSYVLLELKEQ